MGCDQIAALDGGRSPPANARRVPARRPRPSCPEASRELRLATAACDLGHVAVVVSARGLAAVVLGDDPAEAATAARERFAEGAWKSGNSLLRACLGQVVDLAAGAKPGAPVPLDPRGTPFQRRVWAALAQIPAAQTRTYDQLAAAVGVPAGARAVARACAANPIALVIPCHRIVRRDGALGGYRWGVERKAALLASEARRSR